MHVSNEMLMKNDCARRCFNYSVASLIRTPVWEPIPIPQQKVTHLSGNSVIRTVSLGMEVFG